jgi:hypothetical protein
LCTEACGGWSGGKAFSLMVLGRGTSKTNVLGAVLVLVRADLSMGIVEEIGWEGGVVKVGLAMVLPVVLLGVMGLEVLEPVADVKVMGASLLAVTGAMLRAVLGVQCLELVMVVASLVMLDTEGEVNWL